MTTLHSESVDLVLTDPPYGIGINEMNFVTGGRVKHRGPVAFNSDFSQLDTSWDSSPITEESISQIIRVSKNQIIFGGNFIADKLRPSRCWVIWDKKGSDKYQNDFADCELAWTSFDRPSRIIRYLWSGMLQEDMSNKEKRFHPTQKPVAVVSKIIEWFSKTGDTILDPFLGSGTTAIACAKLNRNCIGVEINPEYVEIAKTRLNLIQEQMKLSEA